MNILTFSKLDKFLYVVDEVVYEYCIQGYATDWFGDSYFGFYYLVINKNLLFPNISKSIASRLSYNDCYYLANEQSCIVNEDSDNFVHVSFMTEEEAREEMDNIFDQYEGN